MSKKFYKRANWTDIIISIIFLIFGIVLVKKPINAINALSTLIGIIFIAVGILKLIEYYSQEIKEDYLLSIALISVVFGAILLFVPNIVISMFRIILGLWIIVMGIIDLQTILSWKEFKSPYWTISFLFTAIMIVLGLIVLMSQELTIAIVGISIIIYSIIDIIDRIIFMYKVNNLIK